MAMLEADYHPARSCHSK